MAFDAVPACLELCQQVHLTELVDEANLALNSEGNDKGALRHCSSQVHHLVAQSTGAAHLFELSSVYMHWHPSLRETLASD